MNLVMKRVVELFVSREIGHEVGLFIVNRLKRPRVSKTLEW